MKTLREAINIMTYATDDPPAGGGGQALEDQPGAGATGAAKIELDPETYNALLDRLAELESDHSMLLQRQPRHLEADDIDDLANEGRSSRRQSDEEPPPRVEEIDWDNLTNKQLVELIINAVNTGQPAKRLQQLELSLQEIRVENEISRCLSKHKDFMLYADEVKKLGMENPTLSLEKAYKLAKADDPDRAERFGKAKSESGSAQTRTERLLRLPPRHTVHGEKPGVATGSTQEIETKKGEPLRTSASRAWDKVMGGAKE